MPICAVKYSVMHQDNGLCTGRKVQARLGEAFMDIPPGTLVGEAGYSTCIDRSGAEGAAILELDSDLKEIRVNRELKGSHIGANMMQRLITEMICEGSIHRLFVFNAHEDVKGFYERVLERFKTIGLVSHYTPRRDGLFYEYDIVLEDL